MRHSLLIRTTGLWGRIYPCWNSRTIRAGLGLRWLNNLNPAGHKSLQLYNSSSPMVRPETVMFTWSTPPSHLILSFSSSLSSFFASSFFFSPPPGLLSWSPQSISTAMSGSNPFRPRKQPEGELRWVLGLPATFRRHPSLEIPIV